MKKIAVIIISLLLICELWSCTDKKSESYRNDISPNELSAKVLSSLSNSDQYVQYSREDLLITHSDDIAGANGCVYVSTDPMSINEFGIFLSDGGDSLFDEINEYLYESVEGKTEWLRSYNPSEVTKLTGGKVRIIGDYIVYSFLDPHERNTLYSVVEKALKS